MKKEMKTRTKTKTKNKQYDKRFDSAAQRKTFSSFTHYTTKATLALRSKHSISAHLHLHQHD